MNEEDIRKDQRRKDSEIIKGFVAVTIEEVKRQAPRTNTSADVVTTLTLEKIVIPALEGVRDGLILTIETNKG